MDFVQLYTSFKDQLHIAKQGEARPRREIGRELPGTVCAMVCSRPSHGSSQTASLQMGGTKGATCPQDQGWLGVNCAVFCRCALLWLTPPLCALFPKGGWLLWAEIRDTIMPHSCHHWWQWQCWHQTVSSLPGNISEDPFKPCPMSHTRRSCLLNYTCLVFSM